MTRCGAATLALCAILGLCAASVAPGRTAATDASVAPAMTHEAAIAAGKAGDAAALERLVALHDPQLVRAFDYGMNVARMKELPPAVEAVVVAHFDDARVGAALRAFTPRYRTRALFERHRARIAAATRNDDPSFAAVLRTDLAGIEPDIAKLAPKFPYGVAGRNAAHEFLARRRYPGVLALLVAGIEEASRGVSRSAPNPALELIAEFPSVEGWRRASAEVDRLHAAGRLPDESHAVAHAKLDPLLADPGAALEGIRRRDAIGAYFEAQRAMTPNFDAVRALRGAGGRAYVEAYLDYLRRLEPIVERTGIHGIVGELESGYAQVGLVERFELGEPAAAVAHFAKAAELGDGMALVMLGDTYQLALRDRPRALAAYRAALDEATKVTRPRHSAPFTPTGNPRNDFYKAWLAAEVAFLETGERFHGAVGEPEIRGFFEVLAPNMLIARDALGRTLPDLELPFGAPPAGWPGMPYGQAADWGGVRAALAALDRPALARTLEAMPASHYTLTVAIRHVSALDASALERFLTRNDPSGYWSTCILGAAQYVHRGGAAARGEAARNGLLAVLPGLAAPGESPPLAAAAARFLAARNLRVATASTPKAAAARP